MAPNQQKTTLSLPELHEALKEQFQGSPSLPSLKRWAAEGRLHGAEVHRISDRPTRAKGSDEADATPQQGAGTKKKRERALARVRYDKHKAIKILNTFWEMTPIDRAPVPQSAVSGPMPGGDEILALLADLSRQVAAQGKLIESAAAASAQLNSTRAMLMAKYDAANAQQVQIIEGLRKRLADVENSSSLSRDVQSLRLAVAKISEHIFR